MNSNNSNSKAILYFFGRCQSGVVSSETFVKMFGEKALEKLNAGVKKQQVNGRKLTAQFA